ncbi:putative bifunctional exonuclease/endonuclease protein [anaerobic digester metagenome]
MVRVLIVDTETTGLPRRDRAGRVSWPRLVEVGWVLLDEVGAVIGEESHLVIPEGFAIPPDASEVHGITEALARHEGKPLPDVLDALEHSLVGVGLVVAHNISFDIGVLRAESDRLRRGDRLFAHPTFCTMKNGARMLRTPGVHGFRWPTLTELHDWLLAEPYPARHRALEDARACARCYLAMRKMGLAP